MRGREIRQLFLNFFASRGHRVLPSASLIPANDPSLLWTAAGMVPFKPYFTGAASPDFMTATTCQKCLRTPDIEQVGRTARHHTFFEMLGNFSFGDYFKEKAIPWAWEFVTNELGLEKSRLWISIFTDDDEAFQQWLEVGVPAERIVRLGKDDNFWEIGVGPCGPCSEIYYDLGPERGCGKKECAPGCDCDRYLEIWNLVFIQFFRNEQGEYLPLKRKGIDTGMGLERVASVLQKVPTNFDTDIFREIMDFTASVLGFSYGSEPRVDLALKVIADHTRAVTFAVGDGVLPSNEGRGYVIRRLLRRAARYGHLLEYRQPFVDRVAEAVIDQMSEAYPDLRGNADHIRRVIRHEEERFGQTLMTGNEMLGRALARLRKEGSGTLAGETAFRLYDTYGFPFELTREIAEEEGFRVDEDGFQREMQAQRQRARAAHRGTDYISEKDRLYRDLREEVGPSRFVGYGDLEVDAQVRGIVKDGERVGVVQPGSTAEVVLDVTPCYAEGGGQEADMGTVFGENGLQGQVLGVYRPVDGVIVHRIAVKNGSLRQGDMLRVKVVPDRRMALSRNHTATHLLHAALRKTLGNHVQQAGSLVSGERLRFDFTHYEALTVDELREIENEVNRVIFADVPVQAFTTSLEEAREMGATALFGEKYGDTVRVVRVGDFSMELCGGTHVSSTGLIGLLTLISEGSVGAGTRRVEALTGDAALTHLLHRRDQVEAMSEVLKTSPEQVTGRVAAILDALKKLEHENEVLRDRLAVSEVMELVEQTEDVAGVKVLVAKVRSRESAQLRGLVDLLRERLGPAVIVLGTAVDNRVSLVGAVDSSLVGQGLHAGNIVKEAAKVVDGGGGGKPTMAQAGGKDPSKLSEALQRVRQSVQQQMGSKTSKM